MVSDQYRLPTHVVPRHYEIRIDPDLEGETFSGSVEIHVEIAEATTEIVFNNDGLEISDAVVVNSGSEQRAEVTIDPATERMILGGEFAAGDASIRCSFRGVFDENLVGFYLSRFTDGDGVDRKLGTTQFEATHARKAFPCWDEPAWKATFDLQLAIDAGHQAVANSAEISRETLDDGRLLLSFATTMKMSTYLVAFVVGPLDITDPLDVDGVPLRVVSISGTDPTLTEFALDAGAFALRYFSDYFDIRYPGDKVDLVAIPDFAFGAMENLGCITFREALLLIDPKAATQPELQRAADVINHEIAHMWFGDLVTMKWWNGLWLNEAFATFMEMRCTDAYKPEWQRWVDFGIGRSAAFDTDALAATRPIEFEVTSPDDAEGMFDILTYEKGAAVVRMLEQHLGEGPFRAGIRRYMRQHAYGNAETTDLWDAIEAEMASTPNAVPARQIMDSWIFQGGFPVVAVDLAPNGTTLTLSQERFANTGGPSVDDADFGDQQWMIPLRYRWKPVGGEPVTEKVLIEAESLEISLPQPAEWVVANAEGASFVRISYPPESLDRLAEVSLEYLSAVERYALVDDAWAAVLTDEMTAARFLGLLEMLTAEHDRSVWGRIISGFASLDRLLDEESRIAFNAVVHDALVPALAGLTLSPQPEDTDLARELRGALIRAMGTLANDHEIQEEAKRTLAEAMRDPELVEASIVAAATDIVASIGDEADFNDFMEAFRTADTPQAQLRYLYATADFPDPELHERGYAMVLDGDVRAQNAHFWLRRSMASPAAGRQTWSFIQQHWSELVELLASSAVVRMVETVARLTEPSDVRVAEAFFAEHPVPQGEKTLAQILERQRVNAALHEREAARFRSIVAG